MTNHTKPTSIPLKSPPIKYLHQPTCAIPSPIPLKTLLQQTNHTLITPPQQTPNPKTLLNTLKTHPQVYLASMSRQFAADLPPNIEQTALKDEPKDWFIKTADFGDDYDRVLQHRDGKFTQLVEDIAGYHQIFQEGYDKIILIRPPTYTGYDIQLTAAMQCLGYSNNQFQFIIVQPIKLYAFHQPTQQLHPIPDLVPQELIQAIGMDALRWHSLRFPLTAVAPLNISTAGQPTLEDSLYHVQSAHARCCTLLQQAHQQGIIQLDSTQRSNWQLTPAPIPLAECNWDFPDAATLASQLQAVPKILQQSATEIAPHLVCHHLETISETFHRWLDTFSLTPQTCSLLLVTKQTIFDLLENLLTITTPESIEGS
jgi:arginyl-tRNA synthetase